VAVSIYGITGNITPILIIAMAPAIIAFFATTFWLPRKT
jgi:hypothetical protein